MKDNLKEILHYKCYELNDRSMYSFKVRVAPRILFD